MEIVKICPKCHKEFDHNTLYCIVDGSPLNIKPVENFCVKCKKQYGDEYHYCPSHGEKLVSWTPLSELNEKSKCSKIPDNEPARSKSENDIEKINLNKSEELPTIPESPKDSVLGITKRKWLKRNKYWLFPLLIYLITFHFILGAYKIPSGSMEPTLLIGDNIFVNKFFYGFRVPFLHKRVLMFNTPKRGDVVVFIFPEDRSKDFIKRVVGVSGDLVEVRDKRVYVNGKLQEEPFVQYLEGGTIVQRRDNFGPVRVPKHKLFVLGDNRDKSYDSRFWGFVDVNDVIGKAFITYYSKSNKKVRWIK